MIEPTTLHVRRWLAGIGGLLVAGAGVLACFIAFGTPPPLAR
jgi:hypothetical protein